MDYFAQLEIKGYIKYIGELKQGKNGKDFISGVVGWHEVYQGQETGWGSIPFVAFQDNAQILALTDKDDNIHLKGKLQSKYDKDKGINNYSFMVLGIVNPSRDEHRKKQPTQQKPVKQEEITIEENDLPF